MLQLSPKTITVLRWICFPLIALAIFLAAFAVGMYFFGDAEDWAGYVVIGLGFATAIYLGSRVAPSHRGIAVLLTAVPAVLFCLLFALTKGNEILAPAAVGIGLGVLLALRRARPEPRRVALAAEGKSLRYKGTTPYQDFAIDRKTFFGRDRESRSLRSLLLAERLVVLFAKSGMGKTSLINAGLVEPLRTKGYFPMTVRLADRERGPLGSMLDGIRAAARSAGVDIVGGDDSSVWRFFKTAEFWSPNNDLLHPVLIVDQFEELFTLHPPEPRSEFIAELAELVRGREAAGRGIADPGSTLDRDPPKLKILLSLREDFLADLEDLAADIPGILHHRFRLGPLSAEGAQQAIVGPAHLADAAFDSGPFSYHEDAVRRIIAFLAKRRHGTATVKSDEVEPAQLQLVCQYLEELVQARQSAGKASRVDMEITEADVGHETQLQQVLEGFYDRTVAAIRSPWERRRVRLLCERRLISDSGRRLTEDEEEIQKRHKVSKKRLQSLVNSRLLRPEPRLGGVFYELSHDTLVEPIQQSHKKRVQRGRVVGGSLLALLLIAPVAWWFAIQPKPLTVYATPVAPDVTPVVDDKLVPPPLYIDFTVRPDPRTPEISVNSSVARIELVGNKLEQGISIKPDIPGEWYWESETRMRFQPAEDWPAGQEYVVRYDKSIFAPKFSLGDKARFKTPEFVVELDELVFHQDPTERSLRKVVATLSFTHPVDTTSLKDHLSFSMRESDQTVATAAAAVGYTISYSPNKRIAYIHSIPLEIPQHETYLTLTLKDNLKPDSGPSRFKREIKRNVLIPDVASYFRVRNVGSLLVRDDNDDPVQTITLEFSDRVSTQNLQNRLKVYLLPDWVMVAGQRKTKRWQSPREITPDVLDRAEAIEIKLTPVERDTSQLHSFSLDIPERHGVYVRIEEGLHSDGGFVMRLPYDDVEYPPDYPMEARIAQEGAILPLSGTHRLTFVSRGINTLKVELGRLIDSEVNHLASQTDGDISNPDFRNYAFGEENLTSRFSRLVNVNATHPGTATYSNIDLSEFLPDGGHYFVTVRGWDRESQQPVGDMDKRFVLITDLGLLIKSNVDGTQDIFVHSISSGDPVAGATVELLGKNGVPIIRRVTAVDGHARMGAAGDFRKEKSPTVFVVRLGQDSVFMPYQRDGRRLQYSRFDVGGEIVQPGNTDKRINAQVFTERGLYRPGDTIHLAAIVKRDDWGTLAKLPLILGVTDARGQSVMDKRIQLPRDGFLEDLLTTEASSPTGNYWATLYLEDGNRRRSIGDAGFKVEEFQPDRMRIRSEISGQKPRGWIKPGELFCEVTLENLFGTPAGQRRVLGEYELTPSSIRIDDYQDYTFDDPLRHGTSQIKPVTRSLAETTTDQNGIARLPLSLAQYDKGIYRLTVSAEGFEQSGGRSVKSRASTMLSPLDQLVGFKADGDLGFINKGAKNSVRFLAVDSDAKPLAVDDLTLAIVEQRYVSTLVKRPNGTFAYQSILKETRLSSKDFSIAQSGASFDLPTETAGRFVVQVMDSAGLVYSKVPFVVAGARNLSGNLEKNAELDLSLNGSSFRPGEEIEMEITAPYSGAGLITIEREKVFAYKWFNSETNTSVQRIRVPDELEGNAYVNVSFIRDLNSPEIYVSPLSYAVQSFAVNRDARTVRIEIDAPELVKPGEALDISYTASSKSRVIIYAVDEGILQVARYQQPNPLEFFLRKMALQVSTFQLVDLILPEFEAYQRLSAPGGGEGAGVLGKNLNPFRRKTDAPVVYWSGIVDAGPETRTVSYNVPDYFNGQLRIMAIAVSNSAVGRSKTDTLVRAPFVITPNVLTAAAPGDEFDVNVGLSNNLQGSGENARISLTALPSDHLEIVGDAQMDLAIDEGREGVGKFRIRAKNKLGAASVTFVAESQDETSRLRATLSVRPSVPYVATMQAGADRADPLSLSFERTLFDEFAKQTAAASASPLVLTDGMLGYLDAFPHACVEQMVSKVFPQIGFLGSQDYAVDESGIHRDFTKTVQKLRSRQTAEGGFRFWASSPQPADFPSVYIMHFFTDADALGLTVPRDMLEAGLGYLSSLAAVESGSIEQARLRAYTIYVLTRNATVTTSYLTNLHEYLKANHKDVWRSDLTAAYMAASYTMLKIPKLGNNLIDEYRIGAGDEIVSDFDTRLGRDAQFLYLLAKHFPERLQSIDTDAIQTLVAPVMQNRFNTLSSAYTIMALNAYTRAVFDSQGTAQLRIDAVTGDARQPLSDVAVFARAQVENGLSHLQIAGAENRNVYYVLSQTGFDKVAPANSQSEGLEISRVYLNDKEEQVTQAVVGTELTVRLRVRSTGRMHTNVAVVDILPGGFEVLRESIRNPAGGWTPDYRDIREDRVVIYGSFGDRITDINYRVKLTSAGDFVLPSAYAGSMYNRSIQARTAPGRFEVSAIK